MNRRAAILNLAIAAGGILIMPSCLSDQKKGLASIQLTNLKLDATQEALLADLGEAMIPQTTTPGSRELKLHLFVMKMIDDCHPEADHKKFVKGLETLQKGKPFAEMDPKTQQAFLLNIESGKETDEDVKAFYQLFKGRLVQGYRNSKYVMTNLSKYELIPGRYNGYFPVKA